MRRRFATSLVEAALGGVLLSAPGYGQQPEPNTDCVARNSPRAIAACTTVIDDKTTPADRRYTALSNRAFALMEANRLDDSERDITAMFAQRPNGPSGYWLRGRLLALRGSVPEARTDYDTYVSTSTNKYQPLLNRGIFKVRIGDLDGATADYTDAMKLDASKAAPYVGRALAHKKRNDLKQALDDLDRAAKIEPGHVPTFLERGDIHLGARNLDRALADFEQALKIDSNSQRAARGHAEVIKAMAAAKPVAPPQPQVSQPAPVTPPPAATPPTLAAETGTPKLSQPSTSGTLSATQQAELDSLQARLKTARVDSNHGELIKVADLILKITPDDYAIQYSRGRAYLDLRQYDKAAEALDGIYRAKSSPQPLKAVALESFAELMVRLGQYGRAMANASAALELAPNSVNPHYWRGQAHYHLGEFQKCIADFDATVRKNQSLTSHIGVQGWLGLCHAVGGDEAKATEAINRAVAMNDKALTARLAMARLRLAKGDVDGAAALVGQYAASARGEPLVSELEQLIQLHRVLKPTDQPLNKRS